MVAVYYLVCLPEARLIAFHFASITFTIYYTPVILYAREIPDDI